MQPATITRALVALRAELIREGGPGLDHVEALLQLRGDNLAPVPRKNRQAFKRNECRRAVIAILREGPATTERVAERLVELKGVQYRRAKGCARNALSGLRRAGAVVRNKWAGEGFSFQ